MQARRSLCAGFLVVVAVVSVGCDQIAGLQNNKVRIAGNWYQFRHSFKQDSTYHFAEGIIKRDDFSCGTYKFVQSSVIEVDIDGQRETFHLDFPDDETMIWYTEDEHGKRIVDREWKR